jgi:hypothetical protein
MNNIKSTVKNGRLELNVPADWPDGIEVEIHPLEEGWSNDPEAIADWLRWYDALEPLTLTAEEEADAEAWLRKASDYAIAKMNRAGEDSF